MVKRDTAKSKVLSVLGYKVNNRYLVSGEGFLPKNFRVAHETLKTNKTCECQSVNIVDKKNRVRGFIVKTATGRISISNMNDIGLWDLTI
jgi:hypothetical protein